jgi:hypothetical protein
MTYILVPKLPKHIQNLNSQGLLIKGVHWYIDNNNTYFEDELIEHGIEFGFKSIAHIKFVNQFKSKNTY